MGDRRALTGWGGTAPTVAQIAVPDSVDDVARLVAAAGARGVLARGLGRSYGDAAQNAGGVVLDMRRLASIGEVDPATGEVTCGAGVTIDALLRHCLPQGWFVPVTPGTRQVTLGGAVAADVHGKNHHRDGSFGAHVRRMQVVDGLGEPRTLTAGDAAFGGLLGGMGLCGVVTEVTLRMLPVSSSWLAVDTVRTRDLDDTMAALSAADGRRRYSVAWVDCLARGAARGRGVVTSGDHLDAADLPARVRPLAFAPRARLAAPSHLPATLVGRRQVAAFNTAYYRAAPHRATDVPTRAAGFFHPLDVITGWNRVYGASGLLQYQFVSGNPDTVSAVLDVLRRAGVPGLLAVLKRFGPSDGAPLSFPAPGWTLAVDAPTRTPGLGAALDAADELVRASGGRVYLAKDARLRPDMLAAMYPDLDRWHVLRAAADPRGVFTSDLARRLAL